VIAHTSLPPKPHFSRAKRNARSEPIRRALQRGLLPPFCRNPIFSRLDHRNRLPKVIHTACRILQILKAENFRLPANKSRGRFVRLLMDDRTAFNILDILCDPKKSSFDNIDNLFTHWAQGFRYPDVLRRPPVDER
jgi:hypothetical protein